MTSNQNGVIPNWLHNPEEAKQHVDNKSGCGTVVPGERVRRINGGWVWQRKHGLDGANGRRPLAVGV